MQKIAIFDMDGTLIDSAYDITVSINHVRKARYALPPLTKEFIVRIINAPRRNLAFSFYETELYEGEARLMFEDHYHEQCIKNVRAYEGITETIKTLYENGIKIAVATNAPSMFAHRMLTHVGLFPYLSRIVGADLVEVPKPDPQMLHLILDHHGYQAAVDRGWMIGDNQKDMEAGAQAGLERIFAAWGFSEDGEGDFCLKNPEGILDIILS